ncbi:MAG: GNAT family N-acetyltransferase [Planctomycetia bacterium]
MTVEPAQGQEIVVRLAGPAERAEQARLSGRCFKKPVTAEALAWRYDQSPHGASIALVSGPVGTDAVCGYACGPRLVVPRGRRTDAATVGETGDVMTHPSWRKLGLFRALDARAMQEARARGWPFVYGLPNRRSAHIFLQMGWRQAGTIRAHTHWLESGTRARSLRRREGRWRALTTPFSAWLGARARQALDAGATQAVEWSSFPSEIEPLVLRLEAAHALVLRRDPAWLDWRFFRGPSRAFRAFGVLRSGALVGWFVLQKPSVDGLAWLVDAGALDEQAWSALGAQALRIAREAGACAVRANAIDGSPWAARLAAFGFQPPRARDHLSVIVHLHDEGHPVAREALDASRWWFTDADRDDETMG